jgi:serine protease Do
MRFYLMTWMVCLTIPALAEPGPELTYQLKGSVTKVHVVTKNGGHGVGTGVVVAKDMVATNCHILANAKGVNITKFGDSFAPVALKADWKHDLCIMRFEYLDLKPVELGDSEALQYEQSMFSIGFPGGPPKPLITSGKVKALYPLDDSMIVRTDASFIMGASGSPVFDEMGESLAGCTRDYAIAIRHFTFLGCATTCETLFYASGIALPARRLVNVRNNRARLGQARAKYIGSALLLSCGTSESWA